MFFPVLCNVTQGVFGPHLITIAWAGNVKTDDYDKRTLNDTNMMKFHTRNQYTIIYHVFAGAKLLVSWVHK